MPARSVIRVVAPEGRPETQIWSPSRVTAGALDWRLELHPVLGVEIVAARGGDGEVDASARGFGFGFGGDAADQDAGGAARLIQLLDDGLVVAAVARSAAASSAWICLGRAVQRLQRVGHQQQRRHLRCAGPRRRRNSARRPAARGLHPAVCGASAHRPAPAIAPALRRPGATRRSTPRRRRASPACGLRRRLLASACLRACGVPPAGNREVRVPAYARCRLPGRAR